MRLDNRRATRNTIPAKTPHQWKDTSKTGYGISRRHILTMAGAAGSLALAGGRSSGTLEKGGEQMDLRWRNFLLVVTLAAAAATPAFGQAVVPAAGPVAKGETSAASVPDFSGLWVHANPGYEPLASGPTSLVNLLRRPNGTGDNVKLSALWRASTGCAGSERLCRFARVHHTVSRSQQREASKTVSRCGGDSVCNRRGLLYKSTET